MLEVQKDFACAVKELKGNFLMFIARKQNKTIQQVLSEIEPDKFIKFFI